jgi:hypothetical protein
MKMIIFTKISSFKLAIIILFIFFLTILHAEAIEFTGTVIGKNNMYKKYVRVKIGGEEEKTTFTDENGKFKVNIKEGAYTITIKERNRSMMFDVKVFESKKEEEFKLKW